MIRINIIRIMFLALALLGFGITVSSADFGGSWKIDGFGADHMDLVQLGNHVYGTYYTPQGQAGTIDGYVYAQNVWLGAWTEPFNDDWGYFSVAFSNDTSSLCGSWKYAQSDYDIHNIYTPYSGGWDGYFQGVKQLQVNTTTNA